MTTTYGPLQPADLEPVFRMISLAFGSPVEGVRDWIKKAGHDNLRAFRADPADAAPSANLLRVPMGHFFGGKSVPCVGIAAVAVAPEARGSGLATRMMQECVRDLYREQVALSSLYPATVPLYQRAGYERAGYHFDYRLPLTRLEVPRSKLRVRSFTEADFPAVQACYTDMARHHDGYLDRGPYVWARVRTWREVAYTGLLVEGASGGASDVDGYLFFSQERVEAFNNRQLIKVSDMAARTPEAARRVLQLIAEYASIAEEVTFTGGPAHHFITLLPEHRFAVKLKDYWMLRITHAHSALAARGYPSISADLNIDLTDDQIPEHSARYTLQVRDGRPEVTRAPLPTATTGIASAATGHTGHTGSSGGAAARATSPASSTPTITLNACALAALYTGFHTPAHLRQLGRLTADDRACSTARALFSGGTPSLVDFY